MRIQAPDSSWRISACTRETLMSGMTMSFFDSRPDGLGLAGQREGAVVGDVVDISLARLVVLVVVVFHVLVDGSGLVVVAAGGCGCWRRSGSGLLVAVARLRGGRAGRTARRDGCRSGRTLPDAAAQPAGKPPSRR